MRWFFLALVFLATPAWAGTIIIPPGQLIEITGPYDTNPFPVFTLSANLIANPNPFPPGVTPVPFVDQYGFHAMVGISTGQSISFCQSSTLGACGTGSPPTSVMLLTFGQVPFSFSVSGGGQTFFFSGETFQLYNTIIPQSDFEFDLSLPPGFTISGVPELPAWAMLLLGFAGVWLYGHSARYQFNSTI